MRAGRSIFGNQSDGKKPTRVVRQVGGVRIEQTKPASSSGAQRAPIIAPTAPASIRRCEYEASGIALSVVLSIHNRTLLFRRALESYMWQTLPRANWEIVLVDDMSSEDLRKAFGHLIGRINLRHIQMDHTRHSFWRKRNSGWRPSKAENWFHTPALAMNIGFWMAKGKVLCLCHPEVLQAPWNFESAVARLQRERTFLFATTWHGTQATNAWLDKNSDWTAAGWPAFLKCVKADSLKQFRSNELYWYNAFVPKQAAVAARGVDLEYLNGVAGEDDDFRERVSLLGWYPLHDPELQGLHQDHSHEKEAHRRRDTKKWEVGLQTNRARFRMRKSVRFKPAANTSIDWRCLECVVNETTYSLGHTAPIR